MRFHQFGTKLAPKLDQLRPCWAPWLPKLRPYNAKLFTSVVVYFGGDAIKPERILVIEKDETLAVKVSAALEEAGYTVVRTVDALDGLKKLYEAYPDLIIVARELPMVKGEDPCLRIRQASYLPIIVLGGNEEAAEMLELGADAYMTKPPSLSELVARVRALLRRKLRHNPPGGSPGSDIDERLSDGGKGSEKLTGTEFRLASCLMLNKGRLLGYHQLISEVWGGKEVSLDTLHFYMRRLRQKLASFNIFGVRGVGYCLVEETIPQWE